MPPTIAFAADPPPNASLIATGVRQDHLAEDTPDVDAGLLQAQGFVGKVDQTALVSDRAGRLRLLVGVGQSDAIDATTVRRAGAALARASARHATAATTLLTVVPPAMGLMGAEALAEGVALGAYRYGHFKEADPAVDQLRAVTIVGRGGQRAREAVARGVRTAEAVCLVRDLVNTPGGTLTAPVFAEQAVDVALAAGLAVDVMDREGIEAAGLGGLLGVNRGSALPPVLLRISYEPDKPRGHLALVGKGITFDSGGLSLKTAEGMVDMKSDMSGAAAVLGAMTLLPDVAPRLRATAFLPLTDNMVGPDATRVGDVLSIRNGKTVEVLNTDAEGRLILADGLSLASELAPDAIVDLATLTGACMVALGRRTAGLMGNHEGWLDQVRAAGDNSGEAVWPLPMPRELRKGLDSDIADLRNIGKGRYGGALTAAIFLEEFVGDGIPWVHIDMAGPAFADEADGEVPKGGTGYGVRLLARLFADWKKPEPQPHSVL
ncbi:MAG: leucyl aminopeptidase [Actinomycetota bacterium]|nr:leucyl aminopeptidase [Actinomycetota bacterium]